MNKWERFCWVCKKVAATTTLGACIVCGAMISAPDAGADTPLSPSQHLKFVPTHAAVSGLFRDYREDNHYGDDPVLKNVESAPVMGTATANIPIWPPNENPWEPPTLD